MRIKARIQQLSGKTKHTIGRLEDDQIIESRELPIPAWVEISEEDGMFYLFYVNAEGECYADTCHLSLAEAKAQAEFEFGIPNLAWMPFD